MSRYYDNIAIIQKIQYTKDSISENGSEGNIALRIAGWKVYFESIIRNPIMIFIGYGYNYEYYETFLTFHISGSFVAIPESFFIECMLCGGITALFFGIMFWISMYEVFSLPKNKSIKFALRGLFVGLLFGNLFSGAAVFGDLLYCHLLILMGLLLRDKNEKRKRLLAYISILFVKKHDKKYY